MEIRELREEDAGSLSRLIADVQGEHPEAMYWNLLPEQIEETVRWKLEAVGRGEMADIVAVDRGEVVADCEILCEGAEGTVGIIVGRGRRGGGVGRELLERCASRARELGVRTVRARVMESNARAMSFFRGMGFEKEGAGEPGSPALMSRKLV
jgi:RimJ/RimL family protein N-acetyltransferase